jgi:GTP-binding protein
VDTVGFVRKLPTQLVEAFKSTLEEVAQSNVIVHVVDASHPDPFSQIDAVNDVLEDIDSIAGMSTVIVFNKIDLIDDAALERLRQLAPEAFFVSAASSDGIEELNNYVESLLPTPSVRVEAVIPYNQGQLIFQARENGIVHEIEYRNEGTYIVCEVDNVLAAALLAAHAQHDISEL